MNTENLKPFTTENQPSSEAKKRGWERRKESQKILDKIKELGDMSYKDIKELLADIKTHPENHTLQEVKLAQYLMKEKFTIDYLDRHISKAPRYLDVTSAGEKIEGIKVEIINPREEEDVPEAPTN